MLALVRLGPKLFGTLAEMFWSEAAFESPWLAPRFTQAGGPLLSVIASYRQGLGR